MFDNAMKVASITVVYYLDEEGKPSTYLGVDPPTTDRITLLGMLSLAQQTVTSAQYAQFMEDHESDEEKDS